MITNLLSKNEVIRFYDLMDQHLYSEALPYGQSLLDKDTFDRAGIRFGLMSACVMLKDVDAAEEIAQRISKSMKTSMADVPFIQNKKNWLSCLDPAMLYPLAMVHWKVGKEKTGNTGNTGNTTEDASSTGRSGSASNIGSDKETNKNVNKDIERTLECLAAINAWPGGWKMLKEFMFITAAMDEGEYVVKRAKLQAMYNPITAEGLITCVNVDFRELKEFNAWIEEQKIPSKASGDDSNDENDGENDDGKANENDNDGGNADKNTDKNATVSKKKLTADEAVHDLTLALLYLSRISTSNDPAHYWDETSYKASKVFDGKVLDWLDEVGFIENSHTYNTHNTYNRANHFTNSNNRLKELKGLKGLNESTELTITPSGVYRAREILDNLNINDWDKAEIAGKVEKI